MGAKNVEIKIENGEEIIYMPTQSKIKLIVFSVIAVAFIVWYIVVRQQAQTIVSVILVLIALSFAVRAVKEGMRYNATEYVITNKKIVYKYNLLRHDYSELRLDKIERISVKQSFLGRIFNYGSVYIQGANMYSICFKMVVSPDDVKKKISDRLA